MKYADFRGRASRAELWWFTLFMVIAYIGFWVVIIGTIGGFAIADSAPTAGFLGAIGVGMMVMVVFWLAVLIPTIAVQVRRLHDINRSGWWLGGFYLLYAFYFLATLGIGFAAASTADTGVAAIFAAVGIIALLLFIYFVVLLVFYCLEGTRGANRYGPDPYGADVAEVFA